MTFQFHRHNFLYPHINDTALLYAGEELRQIDNWIQENMERTARNLALARYLEVNIKLL